MPYKDPAVARAKARENRLRRRVEKTCVECGAAFYPGQHNKIQCLTCWNLNESTLTKFCTGCKQRKPLGDFASGESSCRACRKAYNRQHRQNNSDRLHAQKKAYYETHKEQYAAYGRYWNAAHVEQRRYNERKNRLAHLERERARGREKAARRAARDPDRSRVQSRRWRAEHPDRAHAIDARKRAVRSAAPIVDRVNRMVVADRDCWTCQICGEPIDPTLTYPDPGYLNIDHIVPLSRGGEHSYANCQATHAQCNAVKHDKIPVEETTHGG